MTSREACCCDAKPFISVQDVSLRLAGEGSSPPIHWEILGNQHWAVVGPNGAGKSTLMKALCGQAPLLGGKITYHFMQNGPSRDATGRGRLPQDRIAHVTFEAQRTVLGSSPFHQARWNSGTFQETLSVSEYLSEHQVKQINPFQIVDARSDPSLFETQRKQVIELLGIEPLLARDVQQISNGERRKVLLARALLKSPRLLILDNPFTGLDTASRIRLREIIAHLMTDDMPSLLLEGPMCIILVTNHRDEILPGITHVLLLDDGGVVTQGPKESVLPAPPALSESSVRRHEGMGRQRQSGILPQETHAEVPTLDPSVLVQMEGVNVSYSGHQILHQIDWTVRRGEKWALLGPNGAGKTTLLSLLLGDNPQAYANDIRLFGRRRGSGESIWEIKRHIGWVAPELHLYHPKDVCCLDVVCSGFFDATGHHQRCSSQQRETARDWLHSLGVGQLPEVAFGQVSEGEQRLVLMGRALVKRPALLVLDEPCQGLDAGNRDRVLQVVETVGHQPDISLIYVTHQHDALPGIISHLLTLNKGRIVSRGKVDRHELSLKR